MLHLSVWLADWLAVIGGINGFPVKVALDSDVCQFKSADMMNLDEGESKESKEEAG